MSSHLDYEINKELGECYLFMGDLEKAEDYYAKAASSNGVHPDPYLGLATIAVQRGELDKALSLYKKAYAVEKNDKAAAGMALIEMEQGAVEDAFTHFDEALAYNPVNLVAVFGMVQSGYALGRLDAVAPRLDEFLKVDPSKDNIRFTLAGCLTVLGRHEEAGPHLEKILANDPDHQAARELYEKVAA